MALTSRSHPAVRYFPIRADFRFCTSDSPSSHAAKSSYVSLHENAFPQQPLGPFGAKLHASALRA